MNSLYYLVAAAMGFNQRVQYHRFSHFIKCMFHFLINLLLFLYLKAGLDYTKDFFLKVYFLATSLSFT